MNHVDHTSVVSELLEVPTERARKAGTSYLRSFEWDWVWTLTFAGHVTHPRARQALKRWLAVLARDLLGVHYRVAWTIEGFRMGDLYHVHLLIELLGDAVLDVTAGERAWRDVDWATGIVRANRYRRGVSDERSFEHYIGKEAAWDITIACPRRSPRCRRRHGCTHLSGPWF